MTKTFGARRTAGAVMIGLSAFALAACGGGKPSEGDLATKVADVMKVGGLDDDTAKKIGECSAPKMLEDMSEDGLQTIMDVDTDDLASNQDGISADDQKAFTDAVSGCTQSAVGGS